MMKIRQVRILAKLTNANVIRSVSGDQHQILKWIIKLYVPEGRFDYDPTYDKGNFYKNGVPEPKFKSCLTPKAPLDFIARYEQLPFEENSLSSICFDPPFLASMGKKLTPGKSGALYNYYSSVPNLWRSYLEALVQFYVCLKKGGVLVFKCQDGVKHGKQWISHYTIIRYATIIGFYPKDIFILTAESRAIGPTKKQQHARKFHSYFLVFIKEKPKVMYP